MPSCLSDLLDLTRRRGELPVGIGERAPERIAAIKLRWRAYLRDLFVPTRAEFTEVLLSLRQCATVGSIFEPGIGDLDRVVFPEADRTNLPINN